MTFPSSLALVSQMIRDTFRQALASGICWMMVAVSAVCVVLCLSVTVSGDLALQSDDEPAYFLPRAPRAGSPSGTSGAAAPSTPTVDPEMARREGVETISGRVTLAFGAVSFPVSRDRRDAIHFLELLLAGGIAGTLGLLMALVWTAGFLPTFLEPGAAAVLLAKPIARQQLLLGKYLGVVAFVALQVVLFVAGTWLALGVRTGVWDPAYGWCIPLLLLEFAVFYSFSILLAVLTRSTVACVFGSLLFWLLAWGINYACVMARDTAEPHDIPSWTRTLAEASYWVSPKPIDHALILFNALDSQTHFEKPVVFKQLEAWRDYSPTATILSSLLITGVFLAVSAHEFRAADY
jgi:ABC-type transport system involved in multi-copper enzyme maturation permease subunit